MASAESTMDSQGAKSVMSDDMQDLSGGAENISNSARGFKAAISNPSLSAVPPHEPSPAC